MLSRFFILLVRGYQIGISPFLPKRCRFYPTCSSYMIQVIQKYGVVKGCLKGLWRICKCHPFHSGGVDFP
jgi:uncharacterized protein